LDLICKVMLLKLVHVPVFPPESKSLLMGRTKAKGRVERIPTDSTLVVKNIHESLVRTPSPAPAVPQQGK
jgi:hypothetical protein